MNGEFSTFVDALDSPADLGLDARRGRLLVPLMMADEVRVYALH